MSDEPAGTEQQPALRASSPPPPSTIAAATSSSPPLSSPVPDNKDAIAVACQEAAASPTPPERSVSPVAPTTAVGAAPVSVSVAEMPAKKQAAVDPLEMSTEFLNAAIHAVALDESFESTDALMTAAREVYASGGRRPPSRGPVILPSPINEEPTPRKASPKEVPVRVASPREQPAPPSPQRPPSPRLQLNASAADEEEEKKDEEDGKAKKPDPAADEKKPVRSSTIQLSKAEESSSSDGEGSGGGSSRSPSPVARPGKAAARSSSSRGSSKRNRRRPRSRSSGGGALSSTMTSLESSEMGRRLSRLASKGSLSLSTTQLMILEATLPSELAKLHGSPRLGSTTPRIQELAKPLKRERSKSFASKRARQLGTYALLDDAKECTFKPRIRRWSGAEQKDDDDEDGDNAEQSNKAKQAFMDRQFSTEAARRKALEKARREKDYQAKVDKKKCPGCKSTQSFDEVVEKKKRCPNCNLEYQYPIQWQKVARKFYGRQEEFEKVKLENSQRLLAEAMDELGKWEKMVLDEESGKLTLARVEPPVWDDEVAEGFFQRAAEFAERKAQRVQQAEDYKLERNRSPARGRAKANTNAWGSDGEGDVPFA